MSDLRILQDAIDELTEAEKTSLGNDKLQRILLSKLRAKNCDQAIIDCVASETDISKMITTFKDAANIQICFLVDVTGSMSNYKEATNKFITLLLEAVLESKIKAKFRYAYIGYRERNEKPELMPFTDDYSKLKKAIKDTKLEGGDDSCEDVQFGFEKLFNDIEFDYSGIRILLHIADCPCHGSRYHNDNISDSHPEWSDEIPKFLRKLVNSYRLFYWFGKLSTHTDLMIQEFNKILGEISKNKPELDGVCKIYEMDLRNVKDIVKKTIIKNLEATFLTTLLTRQYE
jgi:hypothetical protein